MGLRRWLLNIPQQKARPEFLRFELRLGQLLFRVGALVLPPVPRRLGEPFVLFGFLQQSSFQSRSGRVLEQSAQPGGFALVKMSKIIKHVHKQAPNKAGGTPTQSPAR